MKNADYLIKVRQKNLAKFQYALHTDAFIEDVKSIRDFWDLPIAINNVADIEAKFEKALKIFFSKNLAAKAAVLLKYDFPDPFPRLDTGKMSVLILAADLANDLAQEISVEAAASDSPEAPKASNIQDLDPLSPYAAYTLAKSMVFDHYKSHRQTKEVHAPQGSVAKLTRLLGSRLNPEDFGEALEFLFLVRVTSLLLYGGFLQSVWHLLSSHDFGAEWFLPLALYLMIDLDVVGTGYVPPINVLFMQSFNGEFMVKGTTTSTKRDFELAYSLMRYFDTRARTHNCPRRNQDRDLEILELSKRKKQDRETFRITDEKERDDLEVLLSDDAIAFRVFDSDKELDSDSMDTAKVRRQINVIRQVIARMKKQMKRR